MNPQTQAINAEVARIRSQNDLRLRSLEKAPSPPSKFKWSESRRRYIYTSNGRVVPETRIRAGLQSSIDASKDRIGASTDELIAGKIDVAEWMIRMREEIRNGHRAAALLANGGKLNPSAQGKLGATVRAQYEYLSRFSSAIQNGDAPLNKRLAARAKMYAQAVLPSYENAVRARELRAGARLERRTLSPSESCVDCVAAAARRWQPIGTLPQIGDSICKVNCHCRFEYKGAGVLPQPEPEAQPAPPQETVPVVELQPTPVTDSGVNARARLADIAGQIEQETRARQRQRDKLVDEYLSAKGKKRRQIEQQIIELDHTQDAVNLNALERFRETLYKTTTANFRVNKPWGVDQFTDATIDEGVRAFSRFVGAGKLEGREILFWTGVKRSHYTAGGVYLDGEAAPWVIVHELGHWLEDMSPAIHGEILKFYEKRTKGDPIERMIDLVPGSKYEEKEVTKKDRWTDPYIGRLYLDSKGKQNASELISRGLDMFYADPLGLSQKDPEFFDFIYEALRK